MLTNTHKFDMEKFGLKKQINEDIINAVRLETAGHIGKKRGRAGTKP
jgi:hypothetical protein